ncbi:hypothetical protein [Draconibacterium mangrovi]|uniref:hypothetical protein n=1 Tax=Draconibacterium mangrovi TaxID=2697469 RepID=UPI0013D1A274|nr:hypothetical protein [Draconibacterium mangrovi]
MKKINRNMEYLKAAIELKKYIKEINQQIIGKELSQKNPNIMFVKFSDGSVNELNITEFTNDFVSATLASFPGSESFIITDLATMSAQGQQLTYWLYKGYNNKTENGLVYFQVIDKDTLMPKGELQFSNLEKNIFYEIYAPDFEESSSNAMETDEEIKGKKSIVFLVGNMNEERLLHDIQRLIVDTINNVQRHSGLNFHFILNISKFNGEPSEDFKNRIKEIEHYTNEFVTSEYPNTEFVFDIEE